MVFFICCCCYKQHIKFQDGWSTHQHFTVLMYEYTGYVLLCLYEQRTKRLTIANLTKTGIVMVNLAGVLECHELRCATTPIGAHSRAVPPFNVNLVISVWGSMCSLTSLRHYLQIWHSDPLERQNCGLVWSLNEISALQNHSAKITLCRSSLLHAVTRRMTGSSWWTTPEVTLFSVWLREL